MRVRFYIDGFNFYYSCFKHGRYGAYRWLDLSRFCRRLLPHDSIDLVQYFTARVKPVPWDPDQHKRQREFLKALGTLPDVDIHYGSFYQKPRMMPLADELVCPLCSARLGMVRRVNVLRTEEKGSDVNLAVHLVRDGFKDRYETAVVVSNDSDLLEAVRIVRGELGKKFGVVQLKKTSVFADDSDFRLTLRESYFRQCVFPDTVPLPGGGVATKPTQW